MKAFRFSWFLMLPFLLLSAGAKADTAWFCMSSDYGANQGTMVILPQVDSDQQKVEAYVEEQTAQGPQGFGRYLVRRITAQPPRSGSPWVFRDKARRFEVALMFAAGFTADGKVPASFVIENDSGRKIIDRSAGCYVRPVR